MEVPASGSQEPEKNAPIEVNNINRIILNTLCAEGLRKIKFVLHVLRELLQKKTNILHVYITNDIGHLSTESSRKKVFQTLQEGIELCENESDYDADNRNKIIEDGSLLLNIFLKMKRLNFASVVKELDAFKEEQNLLLNLRQNVYHKKQIVHILKEQIKEQIETTDRKRKMIKEKIEETERRKKIFFVKSMLYYMYKKEYVQANVCSYEMNMNFKQHSTRESKEAMERDLKSYGSINEYIKGFLNKRNDSLQNVHDELVEYYQKERRKRMQRLEKIKNEFKDSLRAIQLKREQIATYDQVNKQREEEEKEKMRREIDEREHLKKHSEYILFLQDVARSKIKDYEERRRRKMRKNAAKKKKK
ncbi:hypothetical protein PVBG_04999 [Plasmodium vivax Brazil I]|uniref:Uncharacterized protein n=1 Tax=Plasmodium vivax (strain Brazil I) TaxID=1033975 RepID=A0A0J9VIM3_PLAV1|nr:hypothetical protein PVBG_04999 [Plasmodium vivax Brazil I]